MKLKLGTRVMWDDIVATIIGSERHEYLLGWKTSDECDWMGWSIASNPVYPGPGREIIENIKDFRYAYWVMQNSVTAFRTHTRLGSKTLQKRMRDQIAQEIFKPKE